METSERFAEAFAKKAMSFENIEDLLLIEANMLLELVEKKKIDLIE